MPGEHPTPSRIDRWWRTLPVLIPLGVLLAQGLIGIDFGKHWDEAGHLANVSNALKRGLLLPGNYQYPSMCFWLTLGATAPEGLQAVGSGQALHDRILPALESTAFKLRLRSLFLILSSLSVLWVYLAVLAWRGSWPRALLASCVLAFSWEVGYHARWVAPDAVAMQFAALALLGFFLLQRPGKPAGRWLAAAAAGAACGTKYPAGLLIVPLLLAWALAPRRGSRADHFRDLALTILVFVVVYLVVTPGTFFEPRVFWRDVAFEYRHYAMTGHLGHTISGPLEHAASIVTYVGTVLFSPWRAVALVLFALALIGAVSVLRRGPRHVSLPLVLFPVLYLGYFATTRAMVVRNLLVAVPFLAVLVAEGSAFIGSIPKRRWVLRVLTLLLTGALAGNAYTSLDAASSIRYRGTERYIAEASGLLDRHPGTRYYLSPKVRRAIERLDPRPRPHTTGDPEDGATVALFFLFEFSDRGGWSWPAHGPSLLETWFGPREVNLNYYPNWRGDDRIVAMDVGTVRKLGIALPRGASGGRADGLDGR